MVLVNRKVNSLKQCFYLNNVQCQKLKHVLEVQSFVLPLVYCLVDNTFEVSSEIHYSCVSSRYCCYGSKSILKLLPYSIEK